MSDEQSRQSNGGAERRCPVCDTVIPTGATVCIMCGAEVGPAEPEAAGDERPLATPTPVDSPSAEAVVASEETAVSQTPPPTARPHASAPIPDVVESVLHERQAPVVMGLTAVFGVIILVISVLILRFQGPVAAVQFVPTLTPLPPTLTYTPTWTPLPTDTRPPTLTPTITPTPAPTDTPRPPRIHVVASGETLIGLSLIYRVSPQSIAAANDFSVDAPVQVNQNLVIPWPTPTPPLQIVAVEVNGETVVLDPQACQRYDVQEGDSLVGIAALFGINPDFLVAVNRITDPNLLQPGDSVCIPDVIYGGEGLLPPTPGPSPTISPTSPPPGPQLLYPADGAVVSPPDEPFALQWVAVKDLAADESYMVEVTNVDGLDSPTYRGFTRDTVFRVPVDWRPPVPQPQQMRWRVSVVQITGARADGLPLYTYGGESSAPHFFSWEGALPTATPTPTPPPTATPVGDQ